MGEPLVARLRSRIRDERYNTTALTLTISDSAVQNATLEIGGGQFTLTCIGGNIPGISWDLSSDTYSTIGRLSDQLNLIDGLESHIDPQAEHEHVSSDLEPHPLTTIISPLGPDAPANTAAGGTVVLRHRIFADDELVQILQDAINRHNPSYNLTNLPANEEVFILTLAQSNVARIQASDATKRRGTTESTRDLLAVAQDFDKTYEYDVARLSRVIPSPSLSPSQQSQMGQGDVVVGRTYRRSPRNGYNTPQASGAAQATALFEEIQDNDVADTSVILRWARSTRPDTAAVEIWRDTQPEVERICVRSDSRTPWFSGPQTVAEGPMTRSKLVYRSSGASLRGNYFRTYTNAFGLLVSSFIDRNIEAGQGGLEPDSDYFYRLYIVGRDGDAQASEVVRVHTLPMRSRFVGGGAIEPLKGPAGTVVTILANDLDPDCVVTIDGRPLVNAEITLPDDPKTPGTIIGEVPQFHFAGRRDVCLTSPSGLYDVRPDVFEVTM